MSRLGVVRIKNIGEEPFKASYDGQQFTIPAHSEGIVPYEAMCLWMGRPDVRDLDAKRRDRTATYQRLRVRYGVYENDAEASRLFPKIEAFDMDGNRVTTVLDDPEGKFIVPAAPTVQEDEDLRTEVAQLKAIIEQLVGRQTEAPAPTDYDDLTSGEEEPDFAEDAPTRLPVNG